MEEDNISLREYIDIRILALEKATTLAAGTMEKRLESMNEFRSQLKDQQGTFLTKQEHELFMKRIDEDIRVLREYRATMDGKASQSSVTFSYIFSVVGIIFGLVSLILNIIQNIK